MAVWVSVLPVEVFTRSQYSSLCDGGKILEVETCLYKMAAGHHRMAEGTLEKEAPTKTVATIH